MSQREVWCKGGKHFYMRESQRGRLPQSCPEHQGQLKPKEAPKEAQSKEVPNPPKKEISEEHKQKLIEGKKRKAEVKAKAEKEKILSDLRKEAETIDKRIEQASVAYDKALQKALKASSKEEVMLAFDLADKKQGGFINLLARKRFLNDRLNTDRCERIRRT